MSVLEIKESEFKSKIGKDIQIVNFHGTWCGPCKMLSPILEQISNSIEVFKIDIDENKEFTSKMGVQSVPTTFIYQNGEIQDTITGFVPFEVLEKRIKDIKI